MKLCPRELLEVTQSGHTSLHVCLFASCLLLLARTIAVSYSKRCLLLQKTNIINDGRKRGREYVEEVEVSQANQVAAGRKLVEVEPGAATAAISVTR